MTGSTARFLLKFLGRVAGIVLFGVAGLFEFFGFVLSLSGLGSIFQGTLFGVHGAGLPALAGGVFLLLFGIVVFKFASDVFRKVSAQ